MRIGIALLGALLAAPSLAAAQEAAKLNQVGLEAGIVSVGLSYARRVGDGPVSVGAGVWGSWEPAGSFDRNVWEPVVLGLFGRYHPTPWLHADVGVLGGRYVNADDCSDCSGSLVGLRSDLFVGHRLLSIGPWATLAHASDDRNGGEVGVLWGVQLRSIIGWDG